MKTTLVHLLRNFKVKSDISKLQLKLDIMLRPASGHYISVESRKVRSVKYSLGSNMPAPASGSKSCASSADCLFT
ncbi:hypothetical protein MSG28_014231 [Choristoneura fumiferana]|uniref:Uncharacterized protein n=1 Tax=Choristoneura fumiferana TaxID=7141 RepID=A0ACC0JG98_CHOFU|nr:hypothetical protein MSG28_014231 [Choristoneura fumiferana]